MVVEIMKRKSAKSKTNSLLIKGVILPAVFMVCCMAVILAMYFSGMKGLAQEHAERQMETTAQMLSTKINQQTEDYFSRLDVFLAGFDPDGADWSGAAVAKLLSEAGTAGGFETFALMDTSGKLLDQHGNTVDCCDREYFAEALSGERAFEFLDSGRISGTPVFMFAAPIYSGGKIKGVAAATRSSEVVSNELAEDLTNENQFVVICGENGEILAASRDGTLLTGKNIADAFGVWIGEDGGSTMDYEYGGERFCGMWKPLRAAGASLFVATKEEFVSRIVDTYYKYSLRMVFAFLGVMILLALSIVLHVCIYMKREQKKRIAQREKEIEYERLKSSNFTENGDAVLSVRMNLTQNTVGELDVFKPWLVKSGRPESADAFFEGMLKYIHPRDTERFRLRFSRGNAVEMIESGFLSRQDDFPIMVEGRGYSWMRIIVSAAKSPVTDDVEAFVCIMDIEREKRLEQIGSRLTANHFAAVALISVNSGRLLHFISGGGGLESCERAEDYDTVMQSRLRDVMEETDYDLVKNRLKLSNVLEGLRERTGHDVTARIISRETGRLRYLKLHYTYLTEYREAVMLACEDVSDVVFSGSDALTGLYNFTGFYKRTEEWIRLHPGCRYRVLRYDLDGFRNINGAFGYEAGNRLLMAFGRYMHENDTEDSFSAHLNADHFVRFCSDDSMSPRESYDRFVAYFSDYELKYPLSLHIGVYDLCEPDCGPQAMSYKALLALQSIKGDFSSHVAYFSPALLQSTQEQLELLGDADAALRSGQFQIWFQPQTDYESGRTVGAEALIRWQHPTKGLLAPGSFLPLFERSRIITSVDKYVWEKSCQYLRKWLDMGYDIPISVNISRLDIYETDVCGILQGLVEKYGIPPKMLHLEITESFYMDKPKEMIAVVNNFHRAGFTVEMDDFGAGYSSLNILKDLDIDVLKLDLKFLEDFDDGENRGGIILRSVIQMAKELNMSIIAEGVETEEEAKFLSSIGGCVMQGYYFSRPKPAEEFEEQLEAGRR